MRPLPSHNHLPSASAAWWLLAIAPLLWAVDLWLFHYGTNHLVLAYSFQKNGVRWDAKDIPPWVEPVRVAIPLTAVLLLALTRRINLCDVGLTPGRLRVTLFWVAFPILLLVLLGTVLGGLGLAVIHLFNVRLPAVELKPISLHHLNGLWRGILHWCILAPLFEEPLYRGIPVAFLERFGGRWLALLGTGVIWSALHFIYGWPLPMMPYYFLIGGVLGTWVYLRTHSLITTIMLHGLGNLFAPVLTDLIVLEHHELVRQLLWPAP
jgi:membrane protease YdiL (CAAX protease family)